MRVYAPDPLLTQNPQDRGAMSIGDKLASGETRASDVWNLLNVTVFHDGAVWLLVFSRVRCRDC